MDQLSTLRTPLTPGEQRTLEVLAENLGSRWEIYIQPHLNGLRPDFVLLNPEVGIVVVEVKDWDLARLDYFYRDGSTRERPVLLATDGKRTFSKSRDDPIIKLQEYKRAVFNLFCPRLPEKNGFSAVGTVLVMAKASTAQAELLFEPARQSASAVGSKSTNFIVGRDLLDSRRIERIVPGARAHRNQEMNPETEADLRRWLGEPEFSREQRRDLEGSLTDRQREVISSAPSQRFRKIRGPAGSGKTLVVAGRAATLVRAGAQRVLIVCYNITLVNFLLDSVVRFGGGRMRDQVEAWNFHYWCKLVALRTGQISDYDALWHDGDREQVLEQSLAERVSVWAADLEPSEKYDAILVDEAQDFSLAWWKALRASLKPEGEMLLAADHAQNLYGTDLSWLDEGENRRGSGLASNWYGLYGSQRLPGVLREVCSEFIRWHLSQWVSLAPSATPDEATREIYFDNQEHLEWIQVPPDRLISEAIKTSIAPGRTHVWADLTLLVQQSAHGQAIVDALRASGIRCIHTFSDGEEPPDEAKRSARRRKLAFYKGDARVKVTTVHSFKGWESSAVVLVIANAKSKEDLSEVYVGLSRILVSPNGWSLTVICSAPELEAFGRWVNSQ
ncbi:MAG: AAA family ATPase [Opitutales bacterium]